VNIADLLLSLPVCEYSKSPLFYQEDSRLVRSSALDKGRFSLIFSLNRLMKPLLRAFSIKDLPSPGGLSASGGEGIKGRGRSQGE
jgi:hypothetical protein